MNRYPAETFDGRDRQVRGAGCAEPDGQRSAPAGRIMGRSIRGLSTAEYATGPPSDKPVSRPRLLDLFCGAGGCAKGYQRAGFYVVGVDIEPQSNYCGDEFVQMDAMEFLALLHDETEDEEIAGYRPDDFVAIHASPPCQAYSISSRQNEGVERYPQLIEPTRELLLLIGLPYVIENVVGAPLINPIQLCGSAFGLPLRRHRLFESNVPMMAPGCAHGQMPDRFDVYEHGRWYRSPFAKVYGTGGGKAGEHWGEAMGIDWMTRSELAEAIPPAYTEHVGGFLASHLTHKAAA